MRIISKDRYFFLFLIYEQKKQNLESICQGLLSLELPRVKAFVNLVMASCSNLSAKSVVELTSSRHYHYHYSNISKVSDKLCKDDKEYSEIFSILLYYFLSSCPLPSPKTSQGEDFYSLSQDICMTSKPASACLADKVYGHKSNSLGNGIVEGYKLGFTHLHLSKDWALPVALEVLAPQGNAIDLAVKQLDALLLDDSLLFGKSLCINNADNSYGNARYLSPLHAHKKLINIVRLRGSMKVYPVFKGTQKAKSNPKIYGDTYYLNSQTVNKPVCYYDKKTQTKQQKLKLQTSIMDYPFDDFLEESLVLDNGKKVIRKVWTWKNMLIRSKNSHNMKDKPFNLLKVEIWNEDQSSKVFDRDMFLAVAGESKDQISSQEAVAHYRTRFDAEGCYRFSKQNLFLGKFQTPDKFHFHSHLLVILASWWMLYAAKEEVQLTVPVWQQYSAKNKEVLEAQKTNQNAQLTPSQVRKGMADLFDTFDKTPYLPTKYKKGKGREKGTILPKRNKHKTVKKIKNKTKKQEEVVKRE